MLDLFLEDYNFTKKEAKIYLTLLELGQAGASTIARFSKENRLTTYSLLKELIKKGYVKEFLQSKIKFYIAVSPDIILERQKNKLKSLEDKMPEIKAMMNAITCKPKIMFFEGLDGVIEMYEDLLTSETDILSFTGNEVISPFLLKYLEEKFVYKRVSKKIYAKVIGVYNKATLSYARRDIRSYRETILIDDENYSWSIETNLYSDNRVGLVFFSKKEISGIIIQSKSLYNSLSGMHKFIWNIYKKISKDVSI